MNLNLLYLQNNKSLPFCARRLKWPPRAYFQVQKIVPFQSGQQLLEEEGIFCAQYWGQYHNGYFISDFQRQWKPYAEDWELVPFK